MTLTLFGLPPSLVPRREGELGNVFIRLLNEEMNTFIEPRLAASYGELSDEVSDGRVDFAWLPPVEASRLFRHCGVVLLAQAVRAGHLHYWSVLFTREDSAIHQLDQLSGKRVAFVHRRSASGYLMSAAALHRNGIAIQEPHGFFRSHAEVVRAVVEKRAHAGSTFCSFEGDPVAGKIASAGWTQAMDASDTPMRIIQVTGVIPCDTMCAGPATSKSLRQNMYQVLTNMHKTKKGEALLGDLFGAERFAEVDLNAYDLFASEVEQLTTA